MTKYLSRFMTYASALVIPYIIMGGVFAVRGVYPFGERSILMADQFNQYVQFHSYYYKVLKGTGSLLYSWEAGMGLNFWGTFAYYLSSPISFSILLFSPDHLPEAFIFMTLLKIGLSGLTMFIFLSNILQIDKMTKLTFSTLYALTSFSISYFFNIMWLDSIYMLPLILLGVEQLFKRKYLFFIISLTLLFICNFYMAYIVGIFTFLYFILRSLSEQELQGKSLVKNLLFFIGCTGIASGISAFLTLPTYLVLKSNSYQQSIQWKELLQTSFGFFEFIAKLYNSSSHFFDMPNVFSGLLVLLLAPLFFFISKIRGREKVLYFVLLCILFLSFEINGLNIIWHAFSSPTGYYQRFAFVFSFVLIYLAIRAFITFEKEDSPALFKISLVNIFIIVLLTKLTPELMSINQALFNVAIIVIFSLLLYGKVTVKERSRLFAIMLLLLSCADMGINAYNHVKMLQSQAGYDIPRSYFNLSNPTFEEMVKELNKEDQKFYRINSSIGITANDSLRYGYRGMSNFNTLSSGVLHQFMHDIGYSTTLGARSLMQNQGIVSSDSLLGFKYMFTEQPINKHGYKVVECRNKVCLYQNNNVLPVGFMMDKEQANFKIDIDNPFQKQNQFLGSVDGKTDYFTPMNIKAVHYHNLQVGEKGEIQYFKKINTEEEGSVEITFDIEGEKQLYSLLEAGKGFAGFNETNIYVNGKSIGVYPTYHRERVLELGAFSNEEVTIKIEFLVPETQLARELFYALDMPKFEKRINQIKKQAIDVTGWTDTSLKGKVNVKSPNTLFLSIPYDKGWEAKVDGVVTPFEKVGGFIGIPLNEGSHLIELHYIPRGLILGCVISITTLIGFIILSLYLRRKV